jgi:hypothetical protein
MGSGLIKHVDLSEVLSESWVEFLTLDLKMRTSKVFLTAFKWQSPKAYGVPHVKIADLINAAVKQSNAFGDELRAKIEELKD